MLTLGFYDVRSYQGRLSTSCERSSQVPINQHNDVMYGPSGGRTSLTPTLYSFLFVPAALTPSLRSGPDCGSYHCAVCGFGVRCTCEGFVSLPSGVAAAGRIERVESLSETEVPAVFCGPVLAF